VSCYEGGHDCRPEEEREGNAYWETEGDMPFLPDPLEDDWWRVGEMGPEEKMHRDEIDGEDGS
jgi:hypothetical protein